jgi:hypothetical protein
VVYDSYLKSQKKTYHEYINNIVDTVFMQKIVYREREYLEASSVQENYSIGTPGMQTEQLRILTGSLDQSSLSYSSAEIIAQHGTRLLVPVQVMRRQEDSELN